MCEYCEMHDAKSGSITYTVGETYDDPPYHSACIEQEHDGFMLNVERLGWLDGEVEFACIPIRFCPWCGEELKGAME